jgi:hypothetical protein
MNSLTKAPIRQRKGSDGHVTVCHHMAMRTRILISLAIGAVSGFLCWRILAHLNLGAGDFVWAIRNATYLLHVQNPYDSPLEQYPMTAAMVALPFVKLPGAVAGGIFYGISSALLAFGITRDGYVRLLVFLAYPYWAGMLVAQWSPLIAAASFFPLLLPLTMAKPQVGLPVALTHLSRRGLISCFGVLTLSIVLMPKWPIWWIHQWGGYQHFVPLLVFPGILVLLALLRWRNKDAQLLILAALMPQRWFFDAFILWLIPKTRRELLWTVVLSWVPGIWRWNHVPHNSTEVGQWSVMFLYMPMLAVILFRYAKEKFATNQQSIPPQEK